MPRTDTETCIHTKRQSGIQTDRHRDMHPQRETDSQAYRQTQRNMQGLMKAQVTTDTAEVQFLTAQCE